MDLLNLIYRSQFTVRNGIAVIVGLLTDLMIKKITAKIKNIKVCKKVKSIFADKVKNFTFVICKRAVVIFFMKTTKYDQHRNKIIKCYC